MRVLLLVVGAAAWFALPACDTPIAMRAQAPTASAEPSAALPTAMPTPAQTALARAPLRSPELAPTATATAPPSPSLTPTSTPSPTSAPTATARPPATSPPTPTLAPAPVDAARPRLAGLALERVATGFRQPLFLTHAGDGTNRVFVVEKAGTIRLLRDGVPASPPFLDITDRVGSNASEQGLLGLAFHPQFRTNGRFFVNYTDVRGDTVVAAFRVSADDPNQADPESERRILFVDQPFANHNGGMLAFGPDGMLYIGLGDGGSAGDPRRNAQNLGTLLGKMLRIDVDAASGYRVPPDNPFVGRAGARGEIWAYGLRNPWRYAFDRLTGDLYIADVGQNAYEEIHVELAPRRGGQNYGWPLMEGAHCYPEFAGCDRRGLEPPVAEYHHDDGCSVTGGYVYRGTAQPALVGTYVFGDYCSGRIWTLTRAPDGMWIDTEQLNTDVSISSFGEDEAGEIYVTDLASGRILRVRAVAG